LNLLIDKELKQTFEFINQFLIRLSNDINELSSSLLSLDFNLTLNDITNIETELSDRHYNSSTVIKIVFLEKYIIYYKPRKLDIDYEY